MQIEQSYNTHARKLNSKGEVVSAEVEYLVFEAENEEEALRGVYDEIKDNKEELIGKAKLEGIEIDTRESEDTYRVKVIYSTKKSNDDEDENAEAEMSFDCGGGTRHITHGVELIKTIPGDTLTTPDPGVLIGWNGHTGENSEIAGVDVPCAQLRETYTKIMRKNAVTTAFKRKVADLTGKVNSAAFKGWNAGEVMFLGCSYSTPSKDDIKIKVTFNFAIQLNEEDAMLNEQSLGKVEGWDYLWTITAPDPRRMKYAIAGIYVTRVAERANFNELGL